MKVNKLHPQILNIVTKAGQIALDNFETIQDSKFDLKKELTVNAIVTKVDKEINNFLIDSLSKIFPEAGYIAEESTEQSLKEYNWIIDPIDGTANYFRGFDMWGISVALYNNNDPVYAILYFPRCVEKYFYFIKDRGVFDQNNKLLKLKSQNSYKPSYIATLADKSLRQKVINHMFSKNMSLKSFGAFTYDGYTLIKGSLDLIIAYDLSWWDTAAVIPMVQELGLSIKYLGSEPDISLNLTKYPAFIAGKPEIVESVFQEVLELVKC